jgi:hypothetical protein
MLTLVVPIDVGVGVGEDDGVVDDPGGATVVELFAQATAATVRTITITSFFTSSSATDADYRVAHARKASAPHAIDPMGIDVAVGVPIASISQRVDPSAGFHCAPSHRPQTVVFPAASDVADNQTGAT